MGKFDKDSLGNRMKEYEKVNDRMLVANVPFIIRLDGVAFHTFTKKLVRPMDDILADAMQKTMLSMCMDVPYCKYGYTQSDEITLVCVIDDVLNNSGFYGGRVNKITTVTAAKATKYFNKHFFDNVEKYKKDSNAFKNVTDLKTYERKLFIAEFDSRVFNIPEHDIINNLIWRQQDAVRNSINALGFANLSQSQMHKKNTSQVMDMLMLEKKINWNDCCTYQKRGCCAVKKPVEITGKNGVKVTREKWQLNLDMPILTEEDARKELKDILFKDMVR